MALATLPTELKEAIIAYMPAHDILSLSRTSKALHAAAIPLLYRDITLTQLRGSGRSWPALNSLLQKVLTTPEHAASIKQFRLNMVDSYDEHANDRRTEYSAQHEERDRYKKLLNTALGEVEMPNASNWVEAIAEKQDIGATMTLLLSRCINLEVIVADCECFFNNDYFPAMLKHMNIAPKHLSLLSRFDKLAHFSVTGPEELDDELELDDEPEFPTDAFLLLFYLPKLSNLTVTAAPNLTRDMKWDRTAGVYNNLAWPLGDPPVSNNLTTLRLNRSPASSGTLELLLRQTPNLKSLTYDCQLLSSDGCLHLDTLGKALSHIRNTLTHLTIRFEILSDEGLEAESLSRVVLENLGSLRSFHALTDLNISLGVLYGQDTAPENAAPLADLLPAGLKRLVINDDLWHYYAFDRWQAEPIVALLTAFFTQGWKSATPELEEFVLDLRTNAFLAHEYWRSSEKANEVRELVEGQGIKCTVLTDQGE